MSTKTDLELSAVDLEEGRGARVSIAELYRTVAALLPAEGAEDERAVSALTAALEANTKYEAAFGALQDAMRDATTNAVERDAAIARADAAEKRVAELEAECASISAEFDLPPTMRPVEGEIRRMRQATLDVADVANAYKHERDEARECIRVLEVERDQAHAAGIREGLERAAAWCEESRAAGKLAKGLRAMKRRVK